MCFLGFQQGYQTPGPPTAIPREVLVRRELRSPGKQGGPRPSITGIHCEAQATLDRGSKRLQVRGGSRQRWTLGRDPDTTTCLSDGRWAQGPHNTGSGPRSPEMRQISGLCWSPCTALCTLPLPLSPSISRGCLGHASLPPTTV